MLNVVSCSLLTTSVTQVSVLHPEALAVSFPSSRSCCWHTPILTSLLCKSQGHRSWNWVQQQNCYIVRKFVLFYLFLFLFVARQLCTSPNAEGNKIFFRGIREDQVVGRWSHLNATTPNKRSMFLKVYVPKG